MLLDGQGRHYFLEMNTRVQVEHPVTELITGIDIVATGIRLAAGEPLPVAQSDVSLRGHALECRIYAEDPDRNFLPSPGRITAYREPAGPGVRVDAGVREGSDVPPLYDALLAKILTWGRTRDEAIARMSRALAELRIEGIKTTLPFHRRVLENPAFLRGEIDTGFIEGELLAKPQ
jgi:acetyl-CoA carboxylase biotin carboxylase subunit